MTQEKLNKTLQNIKGMNKDGLEQFVQAISTSDDEHKNVLYDAVAEQFQTINRQTAIIDDIEVAKYETEDIYE